MHHKNFKNSTANHNNPQHQKDIHYINGEKHTVYQGRHEYPSSPAPQSGPKRSVLSRFRERFQEKPATAEEVKQLGLNAKRESFKTQIARAKAARGSRLDRLTGSGGRQPSYRRTSHYSQQDSGLFGNSGGGSFLDMGNGPSLDFITGGNSQARGRGKKQDSGFTGKGLSELF